MAKSPRSSEAGRPSGACLSLPFAPGDLIKYWAGESARGRVADDFHQHHLYAPKDDGGEPAEEQRRSERNAAAPTGPLCALYQRDHSLSSDAHDQT